MIPDSIVTINNSAFTLISLNGVMARGQKGSFFIGLVNRGEKML